MLAEDRLPCWRNCGSWLLWLGPRCKCCHRGRQITWCGSQMDEPPAQTPRRHDPWTERQHRQSSRPICHFTPNELQIMSASATHRQNVQQLSCGCAPHFEQVVWHRCDYGAVSAVPGNHSHHQLSFVIPCGSSAPKKNIPSDVKYDSGRSAITKHYESSLSYPGSLAAMSKVVLFHSCCW